ncbi:OX-2 membrane glycoprotein-like isoform X2 [Xyrichtys novacula]|uniref:OX-2 membrane glycoprotein-like isoform X2 n=1 Tax=Xyrichtys novacula TaxID=13765 RepID=A0AAV1HNK6_XYRNO|nr:OX-2 membrane glycoprotein-like isoform X2 [Xyrichtys novacula]
MSLCACMLLLSALGIIQDGSAALGQTQETVMADVGEEVLLNCQLMEDKEVHQVTWQKSLPGGEKNIATYSRFSGERVNPDFQGKVEFKIAELQRSSIVIKEVTEQDEGCYRCLFNTWPGGALISSTCLKLYGSAALVQTQETVMAAVGEEAFLNCQLMEDKEVRQVTWQKSVPGGEKNIATYSRFSGERVNPDFQGKVKFRKAGLLRSSIVIKEVTEQDEGCYHCLFNTWPHGALISSTCLKLYELHGPVLQVRESNFSEEVTVSCWASAQPAPTVTLRVQHQELNSFKHTDNNEDGTVTVRATAVLQRRFENSTEVECVVQVPSVPPRSVSDMIPGVKPPSADRPELRRQTLD